jgi:hypothetical protein
VDNGFQLSAVQRPVLAPGGNEPVVSGPHVLFVVLNHCLLQCLLLPKLVLCRQNGVFSRLSTVGLMRLHIISEFITSVIIRTVSHSAASMFITSIISVIPFLS